MITRQDSYIIDMSQYILFQLTQVTYVTFKLVKSRYDSLFSKISFLNISEMFMCIFKVCQQLMFVNAKKFLILGPERMEFWGHLIHTVMLGVKFQLV